MVAELSQPLTLLGVRVVGQPSVDAIPILELFPVPSRLQARIGVAAAGRSYDPSAPPAAAGERLHPIDASRAAELKHSTIGGGRRRVARRQQTLRAREHAMPNRILAIVAKQIGVAVARKAARSFAQRHQATSSLACHRHLEIADSRLV